LAVQATRRRVLVVDDEPMVVSTLRRALAKEHDVVTTVSGREALALIDSGEKFDIILCDLMMPDIGGMDVYKELVTSKPSVASRIIFMTGGAFTSRAQDFLDEVPNGRLDKPIDINVVRDLVRTFRLGE
jgi:CheY-like chemotaxis protein